MPNLRDLLALLRPIIVIFVVAVDYWRVGVAPASKSAAVGAGEEHSQGFAAAEVNDWAGGWAPGGASGYGALGG